MPILEQKSYALFDSWYTCSKVVDAFESRGYYCIGGLKTNRIIYPKGVRIGIKEYARHIRRRDVRLVTVNRSKYYVYRYEGSLNGIADTTVLIVWPEDGPLDPFRMRALFSADTSYSSRWIIQRLIAAELTTRFSKAGGSDFMSIDFTRQEVPNLTSRVHITRQQ